MDTISKYFNRSLVISALLPTTVFILIFSILFPFAPIRLLSTPATQITSLILAELVFPLFLVFWFSFLVHNNHMIVRKFFSGYYLPNFLRSLFLRGQKKWFKKHTKNIQQLQRMQNRFQNDKFSDGFIKQYGQIYEMARGEIASIEPVAPFQEEFLVPTRIGNIFMSANSYVLERYGMIGSVIFPRLYRVTPQEFKERMEGTNDQLNFILNSAFYSFLIGSFSLFASAIKFSFDQLGLTQLPISRFIIYLSYTAPAYALVGLLFIITAYIIYRLSLGVAEDYSQWIKAASDFYRFELLKALQIPLPLEASTERRIWTKLSEFYLAGNKLGLQPLEFSYAIDTKIGEATRDELKISVQSDEHNSTNQAQTLRPEFNIPITIDISNLLDQVLKITEKSLPKTPKRRAETSTKTKAKILPKKTMKRKNRNL